MNDVANGEYRYTECGIDAVYLANGFQFVDTPSGRQVSIRNIDGLHKAIGRHLVSKRKDLSGKEFRFLRHEMLMSQATLSKLLDVSEQAIHRWETGKTKEIPKPAEALVRLLYKEHVGGNEKIKSSLKKIADLEDEIDHVLTFTETNQGWKRAV